MMTTPRFLGVAGLGALLAFDISAALCQDQHVSHSPALPLVVNGADDPERIPDHLAYAHFLMAIAEPEIPSALQVERRHAMIAPIGLSDRDEGMLIVALKGTREALDAITEEIQRLSLAPETASPRLTDLRVQRTGVFDEATSRVLASLSPDGRRRFAIYIKAEVKRRISIYGDGAR